MGKESLETEIDTAAGRWRSDTGRFDLGFFGGGRGWFQPRRVDGARNATRGCVKGPRKEEREVEREEGRKGG